MGFATNGSDRVAICYYMTDLIEIYDSVGVLKNSMHGPEHFFSYFKEEHDADGVTSYPVKGKNRDSYFAPEASCLYCIMEDMWTKRGMIRVVKSCFRSHGMGIRKMCIFLTMQYLHFV